MFSADLEYIKMNKHNTLLTESSMLHLLCQFILAADSMQIWLGFMSEIQATMKVTLPMQTLCLAFLLFFPFLCSAEVHGTLTMTTNNVGRWFTKNNNNVGLQANLDYQHSSGLFLGSSVSNIDYETEEKDRAAHVEIIPYLGWSTKLSEQWRMDTQWSRYLYDGNIFGHQADYNEYYLFFHYQDVFTGRVSFADNYYALGNYAIDYELTGKYPLSDSFEVSASFGYSQTKPALGSDYPYWNAGITYFYEFISLDLRYRDATETSIDHAAAEKMHEQYDPPLLNATVVFSISMGF
jgi:uncharacterized protein (TIGR02001 family)